MKFKIHLITENFNIINTIFCAFQEKYPSHEFEVIKYKSLDSSKKEDENINKELFEEEIEHQAFMNLRTILDIQKTNVIENNENIVIGIGEGIKKDTNEEEENNGDVISYYYGIIHILIYHNKLIYSNESDKVYIKQEFNQIINECQSERKYKFSTKLKEKLNKEEMEVENWYVEMDPRQNRYNLIQKTLFELFDNISFID